ncbi:hypothetical protein N7462_010530 [Penicillium macrosclerotiorum]|uniref:uncharacterized protein n=1 Tax=Penicillium macrosclerotiorum TaxID=303699 RepID=UPI002548F1B2|nr:uncharacterized protein N7462_010530 [Penicillium macrosclerotiorum]KAJ5669460.1 hypothetical protein N7462_010530 [Penicillium macrosclerotiorum]
MMRNNNNAQKHQQPRKTRPAKRPPLTHFLCLPLVNSTSISQLESSIAAFKAASFPCQASDLRHVQSQSTNDQTVPHPLIPEGAIRPLGTLHLTLGVMSLPKKETLDEALRFFHSLDLAGLMLEAERVAINLRQKRSSTPQVSTSTTMGSTEKTSQGAQPFSISLESLHALPRAKAATVLHASPEDPTGRLYPFCFMLRDKFIEAGFILGESKDMHAGDKKVPRAIPAPQNAGKASHCEDMRGDDVALSDDGPNSLPESGIAVDPEKSDPYSIARSRMPKPRPLLLHATVVNTIYVRGRRSLEQGVVGNPRDERSRIKKRLELDARSLLSKYQDFYIDETRATPRAFTPTIDCSRGKLSSGLTQNPPQAISKDEPSSLSAAVSDGDEVVSTRKDRSTPSLPKYPFVWAKGILLDSVCICEMGAKKLTIEGSETPVLNERLGEKYTVVAERRLHSSMPTVKGSCEDVDGSVRFS